MTTIRPRSLVGPRLAQFASTLVVCAGLVLVLPEAASSDHDVLSDVDISMCAASTASSRDHQWTDDGALNAPDSCDDEDGDDDGDDDSSGGSSQAISASDRTPAASDFAFGVVRAHLAPRVSRPLDAYSLRGPPDGHQESSDADVDDDDDDDGPDAHQSALLVTAHSREPHSSITVDAFRTASGNSGHALRAPPQ